MRCWRWEDTQFVFSGWTPSKGPGPRNFKNFRKTVALTDLKVFDIFHKYET